MNKEQFKSNRKALISEETGEPLTQTKLAEALCITQVYISNIETGVRKASKRLVRAFELLIKTRK